MSTEAYIYEAIRTPRGRGKTNGSLITGIMVDELERRGARRAVITLYINGYPGGAAGFVARADELAARYGARFVSPASLVAKAEAGGKFE